MKFRSAAGSVIATLGMFLLASITGIQASQAQKFKVLHTFDLGKGGGVPMGGLIFDSAGNLYGTAFAGGGFNDACPNGYCGAAFELTPTSSGGWKDTPLHDFYLSPAAGPTTALTFDSAGNLYGTAGGGRGKCACGVIFELTPVAGKWRESVLYSFTGGSDGSGPSGSLIFDSAGNVYGTTEFGGIVEGGYDGWGVVFELIPTTNGRWREKVLYSFKGPLHGSKDGWDPQGALIFDASGNLYGTTASGGDGGCTPRSCGTVFRLVPGSDGKWKENMLHSFNGMDGDTPRGNLIFDAAGNLYGTTIVGGKYANGVILKLSPTSNGTWKEDVLYNFTGQTDGGWPGLALTFDGAGNLYGTASQGGLIPCNGQYYGCGVAFKLTPTANGPWKETVLHAFTFTDGAYPAEGVILDGKGNVYGTTEVGGTHNDAGVAFEITP